MLNIRYQKIQPGSKTWLSPISQFAKTVMAVIEETRNEGISDFAQDQIWYRLTSNFLWKLR